MTHPLTGKDIQSIWDKVGNDIVDAKDEDLDGKFIEDALIRTAYDLGADRQLEQVIDWLKAEIFDQCIWPHQIDALPRRLQKAMRPQQQEDNQ